MFLSRVAKECLANQSKHAPLNAFVSLADSASVLARVEAAENALRSQHVQPFPFGQLIALKDNICTDDLPTTAASGILKKFTSPYEATVAKQLRNAGAIIAGKTNM